MKNSNLMRKVTTQDAVVEVLTALRHHCAAQDWDFDTLVDFSRGQYAREHLPTRPALSGKAKKEQDRIKKFGYGV